jgi:DNA-binding PadR family transcriptional regulator
MSTKLQILQVLQDASEGLLACEVCEKLLNIHPSTIRGALVLLERGDFISTVDGSAQTDTGCKTKIYYIRQKGEEELERLQKCE